MNDTKTHFLSIDLEDWYTSAYLRQYVHKENKVDRINESSEKILFLLDKYNTKATFFVLGHIVEENPELIKKIISKGHEIASHGYSHTPLWELTPASLNEELIKTNHLISNLTQKKVKGFRAPYASLTHSTSWLIDVLEENEFLYDSSIFPIKTPLYGVKDAPVESYVISSKNILKHDDKAKIIEVPFTIYVKGMIKIPCTGGIYGRFLPFSVLNFMLKQIAKERLLNFYFHPWEIDEELPKITVPLYNQIVSYYNVKSYLYKIERLLKNFTFTSFEKKLKLD